MNSMFISTDHVAPRCWPRRASLKKVATVNYQGRSAISGPGNWPHEPINIARTTPAAVAVTAHDLDDLAVEERTHRLFEVTRR